MSDRAKITAGHRPGTRGIVLLLLYLSVDQADDRPLIIDQPEENLDPKSIYTALVDRFRQTRLRRQVIIVTHNANLIVNTDADQVIWPPRACTAKESCRRSRTHRAASRTAPSAPRFARSSRAVSRPSGTARNAFA